MGEFIQKYKVLFIIAAIIFLVSRCGSGNNSSVTSSVGGMSANDLQYFASKQYWTNGGSKLVVEGRFFNLSSDYDVSSVDEAVINLQDKDGNVIVKVNVNEDFLGRIPANGFAYYNFTVSSIAGGSSAYGPYALIPKAVVKFTSVPKKGDIGYTDPPPARCTVCGGTGKVDCNECGGTGKMSDDVHSSVLRAFYHGKCVRCDGTGKIDCKACNGQGHF